MNKVIAFVILIAIALVIAIASTIKDEAKKSGLAKKLKDLGYIISQKLDLPDITAESKPYCFMIDKQNKKWLLTPYRAEDAEVFDYCDIVDYSVIYRSPGNTITNGEEHIYSFEEIEKGNNPLLLQFDFSKDNCEYLEIRLELSGKAKNAIPCDAFVMYRKRTESFQHHDYMFPSICLMNAADFENLLYEIMHENKKQS